MGDKKLLFLSNCRFVRVSGELRVRERKKEKEKERDREREREREREKKRVSRGKNSAFVFFWVDRSYIFITKSTCEFSYRGVVTSLLSGSFVSI